MALVPARYVYVVVAFALLVLFYTTTSPRNQYRPSFGHTPGTGIQYEYGKTSQSSTKQHPGARPKFNLNPFPLIQKPSELPSDDKDQEKWTQSVGDEEQAGNKEASDDSERQRQHDTGAVQHLSNEPATVVYSASAPSPTWTASEQLEKDAIIQDSSDERSAAAGDSHTTEAHGNGITRGTIGGQSS